LKKEETGVQPEKATEEDGKLKINTSNPQETRRGKKRTSSKKRWGKKRLRCHKKNRKTVGEEKPQSIHERSKGGQQKGLKLKQETLLGTREGDGSKGLCNTKRKPGDKAQSRTERRGNKDSKLKEKSLTPPTKKFRKLNNTCTSLGC